MKIGLMFAILLFGANLSSRIQVFLHSNPSCFEWGNGICGDGERTMRTIRATCVEFENWLKFEVDMTI